MTTSDRPPLAERSTKSLLGYGVTAGPIYPGGGRPGGDA